MGIDDASVYSKYERDELQNPVPRNSLKTVLFIFYDRFLLHLDLQFFVISLKHGWVRKKIKAISCQIFIERLKSS
jgi:hypothetical protein